MFDWNSIYKSGRDFGILPNSVIDMILTNVNPTASKKFLDIGCGTGQLTRSLQSRGYVGTGIDFSEEAVAIAKSKTDAITYRVLDIEKGDIASLRGPFGLITCKHVYAFIDNKSNFLKNVSQLLEPKGSFVLLTPLKNNVLEEKKGIAVDADELRNELSKYFTIIEDRELLSGQLLILSPKK